MVGQWGSRLERMSVVQMADQTGVKLAVETVASTVQSKAAKTDPCEDFLMAEKWESLTVVL